MVFYSRYKKGKVMRSYYLSLSILIVSLLCSVVGLIYFSSGFFSILNLFILTVSLILMSILNNAYKYLYVLTISLLVGFSFLFYAYFQKASSSLQVNLMFQDLLLTVSLILLWLLFNHIRRVYEENIELARQVNELKRFENMPLLLSYSEFLNRANVIMKGVNRRGENSYLIHIEIDASKKVEDALRHVITSSILKTVRADFDLVTLLNKKTPLFFLQNTDEKGTQIVINRLLESLRTKLNTIELPLEYNVIKVEDDVTVMLNRLVTAKKGGKSS